MASDIVFGVLRGRNRGCGQRLLAIEEAAIRAKPSRKPPAHTIII
jgi:hypothetical protein